jgi:signal transduction histidine kinase
MRSVRTKILLLSFGILALSLGGFLVISRTMTYRSFAKGTPIGRNARTQFEEASLEYENGGPKALSAYLAWQHAFYPRLHFYYVEKGVDLVTREDRSRLLAMARSRWNLVTIASPMIVAIPSPDSENAFIVELPPQDVMYNLPYYLLILCAITILCWGLAYQFASPLNRLAETVRHFGAGDLTARVGLRRNDEIGDVVQAFDQMADRIETLVTAERRLLQDISHELRSPLARLSLAAELVRTSPDRDAAVVRVNQEIDRLTDLSESLLQVTREEGDWTAHRLENVGLDTLIRKLVQDSEIEAAARHCNFVVTGASHQQMRAHPELLRRAIENIFRNAIWHAPAGSTIEVALNDTTMNASVSVRDYGPGVPPETLSQIFRPFFRVDNSRDTATGGVGLGLAIAQRAVHVHRGQIWAENAEPGLRVCIDLPLEHSVS